MPLLGRFCTAYAPTLSSKVLFKGGGRSCLYKGKKIKSVAEIVGSAELILEDGGVTEMALYEMRHEVGWFHRFPLSSLKMKLLNEQDNHFRKLIQL